MAKRKGYLYHVNALGLQKNICAVSSRQAKWLFAKEVIEESHSQGLKGSNKERTKLFNKVLNQGKCVKTEKRCLF